MYEEEKELLDISIKILEVRREKNLSQAELAKRAHIAQRRTGRHGRSSRFTLDGVYQKPFDRWACPFRGWS